MANQQNKAPKRLITREVGDITVVYKVEEESGNLASDVCLIEKGGDMRVTSSITARTQGLPLVGKIEDW